MLNRCPDDMAFFDERSEGQLIQRLTEVAQQKFARLTYSDAVSLLSTADQTFEFPVSRAPICNPNTSDSLPSK